MKKLYKNHKSLITDVETILAVILVFLSMLLMFSVKWLMATWSELTVDEIIYHMVAPLQGTSTAMLNEYILHCTVPAALVSLILIGIFFVFRKNRKYGYALIFAFTGAAFTTGFTVLNAWDDLNLGN